MLKQVFFFLSIQNRPETNFLRLLASSSWQPPPLFLILALLKLSLLPFLELLDILSSKSDSSESSEDASEGEVGVRLILERVEAVDFLDLRLGEGEAALDRLLDLTLRDGL